MNELKVYFVEDVQHALESAHAVRSGGDVLLTLLLKERPALWAVFRLGFYCALTAVGRSFGVVAPEPPGLLAEVRGLLE